MQPSSREEAIVSLRRATGSSHHAIERLLRLEGEFDRAHYVRVIAGFDAFLAAWEPRVRAVLPQPWHAWFAARSRRALVRQDAEALGVAPVEAPAALLADLRLTCCASAFGSMYVLEGSALGGQVVARRAAAALGITADSGGAFFAGWGADTGRRWREFRETLETEIGMSMAARQRACDAAVATFDALAAIFEITLDEPIAARPVELR
jgi:heme oxygenase